MRILSSRYLFDNIYLPETPITLNNMIINKLQNTKSKQALYINNIIPVICLCYPFLLTDGYLLANHELTKAYILETGPSEAHLCINKRTNNHYKQTDRQKQTK